jgi:hypothetical protein
MSRFIAIALAVLFACMLPGSAHAQLKGSETNQLLCLQLYSYFAPDAPETNALRSAMAAVQSYGPPAAIKWELRLGAERLHARVKTNPEYLAELRDTLPACVAIVGMPSPTPAADGSIPPLGPPLALPAADGSVLRCAILLRAVEITSKEDADPGTRELIARLSEESGETLERARLVVETGAGYFSAHGAAGTTMKALLEEGLACVTRYQIRASLVLLSEAKGAGATGREGPLKGYCDDLFRTYGMVAPSPTGFITQLNNHHRDDTAASRSNRYSAVRAA